MTNTGRNLIIIGFLAGGIVIYATRKKPLFGKSKDTASTPPATSDTTAIEDAANAKQAATALRLAINDGAEKSDHADLKAAVYQDYGLNMTLGGPNKTDIIITNQSGKTILNEPLDNG